MTRSSGRSVPSVPSVPLANWSVINASSKVADLTANWHVSRHDMRDNYDHISNVWYGVYH